MKRYSVLCVLLSLTQQLPCGTRPLSLICRACHSVVALVVVIAVYSAVAVTKGASSASSDGANDAALTRTHPTTHTLPLC